MSHTDYRKLVDRGRKAGLRTSELYHALSTRLPQPGDNAMFATDGNGFISRIDDQGRRVLEPDITRPR